MSANEMRRLPLSLSVSTGADAARKSAPSFFRLCAHALCLLASLSATSAFAHEGHAEHEAVTGHAKPIAAQPPQQLTLSKPLQRALGIASIRVSDAGIADHHSVLAEVVPRPDARTRIQAPQAGRLRAPPSGWPRAGQAVREGELLALLEPQLSLKEQSQRRAELARIEQKRYIADINVQRLRLQSDANENGGTAPNNVYREQAEAEAAAYERQKQLLEQSLSGSVEIRGQEGGRLQVATAGPGEVVQRGQALFELATRSGSRLAARVFDAALLSATQANAQLDDGQHRALSLRGWSPAIAEAGWTLWLDFAEPLERSLPLGGLVTVELAAPSNAQAAQRLPRTAVLSLDTAQPYVWLHTAPERFERRNVKLLSRDERSVVVAEGSVNAQDRLVREGAALLDQYRQ